MPLSPPRGRLLGGTTFYVLLLFVPLLIWRCTEVSRIAGESLPPGGEGGTSVPDEGETGERTAEKANAGSLPIHKGTYVATGDRLFDACNFENCYRTSPTVQSKKASLWGSWRVSD